MTQEEKILLLKLKIICKGLKYALDEAKKQYNSYKVQYLFNI